MANRYGPSASIRLGRSCEVCSDRYDATYREQRTCSRKCGVELRRREYGTAGGPGGSEPARWPSRPIWVRDCAWCSVTFIARRAKQVTCSRTCGRKLNWARSNLARRNGATEHICACGAAVPLSRKKCDDCVAVAKSVQRQRKKRAERARKRGVKREPYTLAEIAARDRYRCQIPGCGKRVAMTKAVPHLNAPTIDHVVPLAVGGDDTRANVQLAHFGCNARKCIGGSQQLALIG